MTSRYLRSRPPSRPDRSLFLVSTFGIAVVLMVASTLLFLVILRVIPGMGMIFTWRTHHNLEEYAPDEYTRTKVDYVGNAASVTGFSFPTLEALPQGLSQEERGQRLLAAMGCARCHGLKGQGGAFAPPIAGANPQVAAGFVRSGPGGMPAFSEGALSNDDLAAIAAYLGALTPPPKEGTAQGVGVPLLEEKEDQEVSLAAQGKQLYTSAGCSSCHGAQGQGGFGPAIAGARPDAVMAQVRSGGGGMPALSADTLSDEEVAAIIAYLGSLAPPP